MLSTVTDQQALDALVRLALFPNTSEDAALLERWYAERHPEAEPGRTGTGPIGDAQNFPRHLAGDDGQ